MYSFVANDLVCYFPGRPTRQPALARRAGRQGSAARRRAAVAGEGV